jgi:hypothetical protein
MSQVQLSRQLSHVQPVTRTGGYVYSLCDITVFVLTLQELGHELFGRYCKTSATTTAAAAATTAN